MIILSSTLGPEETHCGKMLVAAKHLGTLIVVRYAGANYLFSTSATKKYVSSGNNDQ